VEREKGIPASHNGSTFTSGKTHDARAPLAAVGREERTIAVHTTGWQPTCTCGAGTVPATILDPFTGSGTVNVTSFLHGRHSIGIDLSQQYLELAIARLTPALAQLPLFGLPGVRT